MKLKGEKELLAEEMYDNVEKELYELTKNETERLGRLVDKLVDEDSTEVGEVLEKIYSGNSMLYTCRKTAEDILNGDFTLDEIRILYKYSEDNKLVRVLSEILEENKEYVNINNTGMVIRFIKNMLILKIKDRKLILEEA